MNSCEQKKHHLNSSQQFIFSVFQQLCLQSGFGKPKDIKEYVEELLKLHCRNDLYEQLKVWEIPRFPVDGATLKQNGCPSGKIMGIVIEKLKEQWTKDEFKSTREELVSHLPRIYEDLNIVDGKLVKKAKTNK